MVECRTCGKRLQEVDRAAAISGSIMGDEHTDVFYFCATCQVYTVAKSWDNFTGVETVTVDGPLPKAEGDRLIDLIRRCSEPWDKKCRCAAHLDYFRDTLD